MFLRTWETEICERAAAHVPVPENWQRASGNCVCLACGREYFDHPNAVPHLWLRLLCDGRYVKL